MTGFWDILLVAERPEEGGIGPGLASTSPWVRRPEHRPVLSCFRSTGACRWPIRPSGAICALLVCQWGSPGPWEFITCGEKGGLMCLAGHTKMRIHAGGRRASTHSHQRCKDCRQARSLASQARLEASRKTGGLSVPVDAAAPRSNSLLYSSVFCARTICRRLCRRGSGLILPGPGAEERLRCRSTTLGAPRRSAADRDRR